MLLGACEGTGSLGNLGTPPAGSLRVSALIGPPEDVKTRVLSAVGTRATAAGLPIAIDDKAPAQYTITGYMSAATEIKGTEFAYVWDVFDAGGERAHRIAGSVAVEAQETDPWQTVDAAAADAIAERIVTDLKDWYDENVPPEPPPLPTASPAPATASATPAPAAETASAPAVRTAATDAVLALAPAIAEPSSPPSALARRRPSSIAPAARLPASPQRAIVIGTITGAPGNGEAALRNAMGRSISPYGFRPVAGRPAAFILTADVTTTPPERNRQSVAIIWSVAGADGRPVGTIRQLRSVQSGALDGNWGVAASTAADAAANGIATLIQTKL
jgi:hypothetical protein